LVKEELRAIKGRLIATRKELNEQRNGFSEPNARFDSFLELLAQMPAPSLR